ncbi:hypothetical protein [Kineosporia succinea]|uniref:Ricin-type beta-trefoil lectin protein n=1 Tax=Kineosporia succinea TaxID=84632 RepID=A0ABT9P027_9ACTN|nr:hypothetical protein [Kineosporia succinea]MDP9826027.1 hypothetical protein [Kineosporia succinea]
MDETEYRLRELQGAAEQSGRLPSAAELRRRGDRRRTAQRARLAVGTFAVVAVIAGGVTAWIGPDDDLGRAVPAGPATTSTAAPRPTGDGTPTPTSSTSGSAVKVPSKTDALTRDGNEQFWIWAAGDGSRMLTYGPESGLLDLTKADREETWHGYSGQMLLIPIPGTDDVWEMADPSSDADLMCVTVGEADFRTEICDDSDVKQQFRVVRSDDGATYSLSSVSRERSGSMYVTADGDSLTWSGTENDSTAWIFEAAGD